MTIAQTVSQPVLPAYIELFDVDALAINGNIYRLTPMTDGAAKVSWGGNDYDPFPIAINGLSQTSTGAPARPQLVVSNVDRFFGTLVQTLEDMVGAVVTYRRTFASYLGTSVSAAPMIYTINRKMSHNKTGIIFELRSTLDFDHLFLPRRQMLRDGPDGFPGLGINKRTS